MFKYAPSGLSRELFQLGELRETILNAPSIQVKKLPFYNDLPDNYADLLKLRLYIRERAMDDLEFRNKIIDIVSEDVCAFANLLVYVFEPRPPAGPKSIPLMLWPDQADVLTWFDECFGRRDAVCEKSRGIGMSWTIIVLFYHKWRFMHGCKLGICTKDESTLDGPDANFLLGKFQFIHDNMPAWLRVDSFGNDIMKRTIQDHTIVNTIMDSTITGYAPTDMKPRSLRFTAFAHDEHALYPRNSQEAHASVSGTTNSIFFISTWHSHDDAFDALTTDTKSGRLRIRTYWWNNPDRWQGAYTTEAGRLKLVDKDYIHPPNYPFELDGLLRSPWVDFEIRRASIDKDAILRDLYGRQAEGTRKFFRIAAVQIVKTTANRMPLRQGDFQDGKFRDNVDGIIKIFGEVGDGVGGPFAAGSDLSFGRGQSFSSLEVIDLSTGKQVLDAASNEYNPVEWAQFVFEVVNWLNGDKGDGHTYVSFENNGDQATSYVNELLRLGYGNIEINPKLTKVRKNDQANYYGVHNKDGGRAQLLELERAVIDGTLVIQSPWCKEEFDIFDKDDDGKPKYPNNAIGHGDRLQGLGVAWHVARKRLVIPVVKVNPNTTFIPMELRDENKSRRWSEGWTIKGKRKNFAI